MTHLPGLSIRMSFLFASCFSLGPLVSLLNMVTSPTYLLLPGIQVESCLFSTLPLPASVLRKPPPSNHILNLVISHTPAANSPSMSFCLDAIHCLTGPCLFSQSLPGISGMKSFKQIPFSSAEPSEAVGAVSLKWPQRLSVRLCSFGCTSLSPQL